LHFGTQAFLGGPQPRIYGHGLGIAAHPLADEFAALFGRAQDTVGRDLHLADLLRLKMDLTSLAIGEIATIGIGLVGHDPLHKPFFAVYGGGELLLAVDEVKGIQQIGGRRRLGHRQLLAQRGGLLLGLGATIGELVDPLLKAGLVGLLGGGLLGRLGRGGLLLGNLFSDGRILYFNLGRSFVRFGKRLVVRISSGWGCNISSCFIIINRAGARGLGAARR
jgi:hypothetical protein